MHLRLATPVGWRRCRALHAGALLAEKLREKGVEMIALHRNNWAKKKTQDGRKLRRYRKRWKVERFFAWLFNFRRTLVRHEYKVENYLAFVLLVCMKIMLRYF